MGTISAFHQTTVQPTRYLAQATLPEPQEDGRRFALPPYDLLNAALNGRADAIVTFNVADFERATSRFGLPVVTATSSLRGLGNG